MKSSKILLMGIVAVLILVSIITYRTWKSGEDLIAEENAPSGVFMPYGLGTWREFHFEDDNFKVSLPTPPQHASEDIPSGSDASRKYNLYLAEEKNGTIFIVNLITYPDQQQMNDLEESLKTIVKDLSAAEPSNQLVVQTESLFLNHKAIDFSIKNDESQIDGRIFNVDKTLFILMYMARIEHYQKGEFDRFVGSFQFLSPNQ